MKVILKWYIRIFMFLLPVFFLPTVVDAYGMGKNLFMMSGALIGLVLWTADLLISKKNTVKLNGFLGVLSLLLVWSLITWFFEPQGVKMNSLMMPMGLGTIAAATAWVFLWIQVTDKNEYKKQFNFVMAAGIVVAISSLVSFLIPTSRLPFQWPKENPILSISEGWSLTGSLLSETILLLFLTVEWVKRLVAKLKPAEGETGVKDSYIKEAVAVAILALVLFLDIYRTVKMGWVYLDGRSAWSIAVESLKVSPILGVGIGNFIEAFNLFRPVAYNTTAYWNSSFGGSSIGILNIWTETGLVGLVLVAWMTSMWLKHKKNNTFWQVGALWLILILLPMNLVGYFLTMWLMSTLLFEGKEIKLILEVGEKKFNVMPWLVSVLTLGLVGFVGWNWTKIIIGETFYKQSLVAAAKNNGTKTYELQIKAIGWNPTYADYRRLYSQTNLALAETILSNKDVSDEDKQKASTLVQQAVREAKAAVSLDAKNPLYWSNLAAIYKQLVGLVEDAASWSYEAYSQAIALDPVNPTLKLDLGGLLYAAESYDEADRVFQQAVQVKNDYANAWYNWAYSAKKMNNLTAAVSRLTNAVKLVEVDSGDYDKANKELESWNKELEEATKKQQEAQKQQQEAQKQPETLKAPEQKLQEATNSAKVNVPSEELQPPVNQTEGQVTQIQ